MSKGSTKHKIEVPIGALLNTEELGTATTLQRSDPKGLPALVLDLSLEIPEQILSHSTDILENFTYGDGLITPAFTSHTSWAYNSTPCTATGASESQTDNH